ncbi:hypothetical protein [Sphingobacterium sp. SYP-B4668]|uniref:hypothetical protein n=1 Tax=Sphingobacterium sp. SYP-B4668 TaxID=2996035 RepID=UPI0022DD911E|nr:hypothetical protein [Sphingobacterium sp. SYP-B4668]
MLHSFHIPVLGLAFSIDSPLKVAKYGISSVISIVDDELIERIRIYYSQRHQLDCKPITKKEYDFRAMRITSYLNLVKVLVQEQIEHIRQQVLETSQESTRYFNLLPEGTPIKMDYNEFITEVDPQKRSQLAVQISKHIQAGDIDVNIMSKVDKMNVAAIGHPMDEKLSDALAALRGFANSELQSSVVLSAGMNPRLYTYISELEQFWPKEGGTFNKKVTLKVSDYRSASIQAKFLAKKGVWVSEFRIESGLNCGGHAFATDGFLLGPILEEFKNKKKELQAELFHVYQQYWSLKSTDLQYPPPIKYTVQGGIGTADEHRFLLEHYDFDAVGWGSPFLLVPEATTLDDQTLNALSIASADDFYISDSSPLGVPFNNFRLSSAEKQRIQRIQSGRPGSPCKKKYLISNTEYTEQPICTASREYQHLKIKELQEKQLPRMEYEKEYENITVKTCLCDGLAAPAYIKYGILKPREIDSVSICPGPNTSWFKGIFSLDQMVNHIYGRDNLLKDQSRPFFLISELKLYVTHIQKYVEINMSTVDEKKIRYLDKFKRQLQEGISYYKELKETLNNFPAHIIQAIPNELLQIELQLEKIKFS